MTTPAAKVSKISAQMAKKERAKFEKMADPEGLFNIPFDAILRGSDAANGDKSDPLFLGPAQGPVRRVFQEFGIEEMPATWGELMGGLHYCQEIHGGVNWTQGGSKRRETESFAATLRVSELYTPELTEAFKAYFAEDKVALRELCRTRLTLPYMSTMWSESQGWKAYKRKVPGGTEPADCTVDEQDGMDDLLSDIDN